MNAVRETTTGEPQLDEFLADTDAGTVAYIDGPGPLPQVEEEALRNAVRSRLEDQGAPSDDIEAIRRAMQEHDGTPSPSARYLLAAHGRMVVDRTFPGARLGPEVIAAGPTPPIVPLLRQLARRVHYIVVETGREGATVRLERADQSRSEQIEDIEGRTDHLTKVQAGGLSHARYQRSAEEVWKHNQAEVAGVIDLLAEEHHPAFILIAGDVRARGMLVEQLGEAASCLVIGYDTHTRAAGSNDDGLERAIEEAAEQYTVTRVEAAAERAKADDGRAGARGLPAVVHALQQARVSTLILDASVTESTATLPALDVQPWVAADHPTGISARTLTEAPIAEALARAAILTGAGVLFREPDFAAHGGRRGGTSPEAPLAALRWPDQDS